MKSYDSWATQLTEATPGVRPSYAHKRNWGITQAGREQNTRTSEELFQNAIRMVANGWYEELGSPTSGNGKEDNDFQKSLYQIAYSMVAGNGPGTPNNVQVGPLQTAMTFLWTPRSGGQSIAETSGMTGIKTPFDLLTKFPWDLVQQQGQSAAQDKNVELSRRLIKRATGVGPEEWSVAAETGQFQRQVESAGGMKSFLTKGQSTDVQSQTGLQQNQRQQQFGAESVKHMTDAVTKYKSDPAIKDEVTFVLKGIIQDFTNDAASVASTDPTLQAKMQAIADIFQNLASSIDKAV